MGRLASAVLSDKLTATRQFSCLPTWPQYCRVTPTECFPFFGNPVSSTIQATTGPRFCMVGNTRWRNWLDALALTGEQQTLAIVLQRRVPVFVPRGARQAVDICREASLLWAWRGEVRSHTTILHENILF